MLTIYLLYGNSYAKKLIFKEIVDLVLYNATFLMTFKVSSLMEEEVNKNYDSSKLEPNPQVEELMGGGNVAFLQAIMFFSFMVLYRVLSQESQLSIPKTYSHNITFADAAIQIIPENLPTRLEDLKKGINNPTGNIIFDPKDPTHIKEFTRLYGTIPVVNNTELTRQIDQYMNKYVKILPVMTRLFDTDKDNFLHYINQEITDINLLIRGLFSTIENACNSVTRIAREDQLPIELYKLVNATLIDIVENIAEPKLFEQIDSLNTIIETEAAAELRDEGVVPVNVTTGTRIAAVTEDLANKATKTTGSLLGFLGWATKPNAVANAVANSTLTNSTLTNYTLTNSTLTNSTYPSANDTLEKEKMYDEALEKRVEEKKIQQKIEVEQNIVFESVQNATKDFYNNRAQLQSNANRKRYFNNVCDIWFGIPPQLNYDQQNGILAISNSAESFASFKIILQNIEDYADRIGTSNVNEDKRKSLIQRAKLLNEFIDRYNGSIERVMNKNQQFGTIQDFTLELRKVVNGLNAEVAFVSENSFPIDIKIANEEIKRARDENELIIKQKDAEQKLITDIRNAQAQRDAEGWQSAENVVGANVEGAVSFGSTFVKESVGNPIFDTINYTLNKSGESLNILGENMKNVLLYGGGFFVVAGGIWFLSASIFKLIRAKIDKETGRITNDTSNKSSYNVAQGQYNSLMTQRKTPRRTPIGSRWDQMPHNVYIPKTLPSGKTSRWGPPIRGGIKTRKRAKKSTRKFKRGKRRQTGRKTQRR
jgi:hypothetical protein